jgi:hypothetical protein
MSSYKDLLRGCVAYRNSLHQTTPERFSCVWRPENFELLIRPCMLREWQTE